MKILAIADEESPALWDHYTRGRLDGLDLIISCGDLKAEYLSFLVTMARCPVLYVHGNHDESYDVCPPEGCDCIDDALVVYNGVRILGLGGCRRYHPGRYQYTESDMRRRIRRLRLAIRRAGGVDLVVTHAPPRGLGDLEDPAHQGFEALRDLLDRYHPSALLHGHIHLRYGADIARETPYGKTTIRNVSGRCTFTLPDAPCMENERNRLLWKTRHRESSNGFAWG